MKNTKNSLWQPVSEKPYNKKYLLRKVEELEAEQLVKTYERKPTHNYPEAEEGNKRPT